MPHLRRRTARRIYTVYYFVLRSFSFGPALYAAITSDCREANFGHWQGRAIEMSPMQARKDELRGSNGVQQGTLSGNSARPFDIDAGNSVNGCREWQDDQSCEGWAEPLSHSNGR